MIDEMNEKQIIEDDGTILIRINANDVKFAKMFTLDEVEKHFVTIDINDTKYFDEYVKENYDNLENYADDYEIGEINFDNLKISNDEYFGIEYDGYVIVEFDRIEG